MTATGVADSPAGSSGRNRETPPPIEAPHNARLDLPYAERFGTNCFDLYPSADRDPRRVLFFCNGGYWQRNSREAFACVAEGRSGRMVVAIPAIPWRRRPVCGYRRRDRPGDRLARLTQARYGIWRSPRHRRLVGGSASSPPSSRPSCYRRGLASLRRLRPRSMRETGLNNALKLSETEIETRRRCGLFRRQNRSRSPTGDENCRPRPDSLKLFPMRQALASPGRSFPSPASITSRSSPSSRRRMRAVKAAIELLSHV